MAGRFTPQRPDPEQPADNLSWHSGRRATLVAAVAGGARSGLPVGAALLLAALVGMLEQFNRQFVIQGALLGTTVSLTLGQAGLIGGLAAAGYHAARRPTGVLPGAGRDRDAPPPRTTATTVARFAATGAVAGMLAAAVLAGFVFFVTASGLNVRSMLVNATPGLLRMLSYDRDTVGLGILVLVGAAAGISGALVGRLPPRARQAVHWGVALLLLAATLQELLRFNLGRNHFVYQRLYSRQGLSPSGARDLWLITFAAALAVPWLKARWRLWVGRLVPARRHTIDRAGRAGTVAGIAIALFFLPWVAGTYLTDVMDTVGIFILMGLGLNIVVGFAGLLDLGYVAFFAIGAYTIGVLTSPDVGIELSFWQALPVAVMLSIISGILLGIPVLKTHGDYLAIITLGFGEIIGKLAISTWLSPYIGGAQGLKLIPLAVTLPRLNIPFVGTVSPSFQQAMYFPIVAACVVGAYVAWRMHNSRYGRAWMAVREDESVAEALGINRVETKLLAFATGAALAGTAGALFASKLQSIFPHSFGLLISINVLVLIIVGGMGSLPGVFVGALVLVGLPELLREFKDYRLLLYGALLVIMMLTRPEGLWPTSLAKRELHAEAQEPPPRVPQRTDGGIT